MFLLEWRPASPELGLAEFGDRLIFDYLEAVGDVRWVETRWRGAKPLAMGSWAQE